MQLIRLTGNRIIDISRFVALLPSESECTGNRDSRNNLDEMTAFISLEFDMLYKSKKKRVTSTKGKS